MISKLKEKKNIKKEDLKETWEDRIEEAEVEVDTKIINMIKEEAISNRQEEVDMAINSIEMKKKRNMDRIQKMSMKRPSKLEQKEK